MALSGDHAGARDLIKDTHLIEQNFLQLSVLLDPDVTVFSHQEALTLESMMGSMGGILNIWVGITFVTIVEILDFFVHNIIDRLGTGRVNVNPITDNGNIEMFTATTKEEL